MMRKIVYSVVFTLIAFSAGAQQEPQFTFYSFNPQTINPAYAGSRGTQSLNAQARTQWVGFNNNQTLGEPNTYVLGFHTPLGEWDNVPRVAIGAHGFYDEIGITKTIGFFPQFAYRIPFRDIGGALSLGLQAGFKLMDKQLSSINNELVIQDPTYSQDINYGFLPNVGLGAYFYTENYYAGFSVPYLLNTRFNREDDNGAVANDIKASEERHYYLAGGGVIPVSYNVKLKGTALVKFSELPRLWDAEVGIHGIFFDRIALGIQHRLGESISALLEMQITHRFRAGYAYDFGIGDFAQEHNGSHELVLGIDFGSKVSPVDPRFIRYF